MSLYAPLSLSLAIALASLPAHAQQRDATDLDAVVVTATRTTRPPDRRLAPVQTIERAEIERSAARSLPELLHGRAGISLANQGGLGKVSTVFMRGTESDHVLLLVDGVRVGSATSGLPALQDIPLELIERIEIVRGPHSALYGSEAIGGVIQVFTRRGHGDRPVTPRGRIGVGSDGLREIAAGADLRAGSARIGIDLAHQSGQGIDACRGAATPVFAGCGMDHPDPDRDGHENTSAAARVAFAPADAWQVEAHALRSLGRNQYDADPAWGLPDNSRTLQQVLGGRVRWDPTETLALTLSGGRNRDASENFLQRAPAGDFASTRRSASLQADATLAPGHLLSLGLDWLHDRGGAHDASASFDAARGNRALFAQYQGNLGAHALQAALRRDRNDQFGAHTTGSLAWGMAIGGIRVNASIGSAFKAPSFNELYYPWFGNPALRPETSRSLEWGVAGGSAWAWRVQAWQTRVEDLISWDAALFSANNIERARLRGIEAALEGRLGAWQLATEVGLVDARNRSDGAHHGLHLPRRAPRNARIALDRRFERLELGATAIAEAARWDDAGNLLRVPGFATLDLRAGWTLAPRWRLQGALTNALDRRYETVAFYRQPGRGWLLTLRYTPAE